MQHTTKKEKEKYIIKR